MPLGASAVVGEAARFRDINLRLMIIGVKALGFRSMGSVVDQYAPLLGLSLPSPWAAPPSPVVAQYSCFVTNLSASWLIPPSSSTLAPPAGATMACSSIDIKTYIDGALTLWGEMQAMAEKIVAAEEAESSPIRCLATVAIACLHISKPCMTRRHFDAFLPQR
jgi:hypothetical protein